MEPAGIGLSGRTRAGLAAWAFIGTALHAGSFALLEDAGRLLPIATGIGLSAGLSWLVMGVVVLGFVRGDRARLARWFDTCLVAMGVGECLLVGAAGLNAVVAALRSPDEPEFMLSVHVAILVAADAAMAGVFAWRARKSGEKLASAAILWVVVLNGSFALFMVLLAGPLGYGG